jgi:hypothetical protein
VLSKLEIDHYSNLTTHPSVKATSNAYSTGKPRTIDRDTTVAKTVDGSELGDQVDKCNLTGPFPISRSDNPTALDPTKDIEPCIINEKAPPFANTSQEPKTDTLHSSAQTQSHPRLSGSKFQVPSHSKFKIHGSRYMNHQDEKTQWYWWGITVFVLGAIPYAVIGSLTHFQHGQSAPTQRVFTMFWLASGVFLGATLNFYKQDIGSLFLRFRLMRRLFFVSRELQARTPASQDVRRSQAPIPASQEATTLQDPTLASVQAVLPLVLAIAEFAMNARNAVEESMLEYELVTLLRLLGRETRFKMGNARAAALWSTLILLAFITTLFFGVAAIGGFVIVGQMLMEYGSCISLS